MTNAVLALRLLLCASRRLASSRRASRMGLRLTPAPRAALLARDRARSDDLEAGDERARAHPSAHLEFAIRRSPYVNI